MADWNIRFAKNVAGCYTVVEPNKRQYAFHDLFKARVDQFVESRFWLDEIITYAIRHGLLSSEVYTKDSKTMNRKLLTKGWGRCFSDTRLLVFAYAISPPDLLRYLLSPRGTSWATRFLETNWDSIMREVAKRRVPKTQRLALQSIKNDKTGVRT